jgi:hypothetical protein
MPEADRLSVRDHTAIYEAVAARDPMSGFHCLVSRLRLVSKLYNESKRLSDEILVELAHQVSERVEREMDAMWPSPVARRRRKLHSHR